MAAARREPGRTAMLVVTANAQARVIAGQPWTKPGHDGDNGRQPGGVSAVAGARSVVSAGPVYRCGQRRCTTGLSVP